MKVYSSGEAITLDAAQVRRVEEDISRFLNEGRLEEVFEAEFTHEPGIHEQLAARTAGREPEELNCHNDERRALEQPVLDVFERASVACYLKEVANYPLLTREREVALAHTLREGQHRFVELVAGYALQDASIQKLNEKVRRLLSREKTFPGVRDKALRLVRSTLERLAQTCPDHHLYPEMLAKTESIMLKMDTARQEMVRANLRLVLSIAKRYRGRGMSFEDLIQEGNMGLITAVGRFDHTRGYRFSTYATHWIRQSILRAIYVKTRTIRLPVHFVELRNRFFKVFYELLKELGREPTPQEIATRARLSVDKIQQVLKLSLQPISLETPVGDDGHRLGDFIEDQRTPSPVNQCSHGELAEAIRQLLTTLQPREVEVIRLRFGLEGQAAETLERIGQTFKVSKERIRQIEKKALEKLRKLNRQGRLVECMD